MPLLRFDGKLNASVWDGQNNQIIWGRFNATASGYGVPLNSNRTWAMRGNADDGGKALGTGQAYLFNVNRLLITHAQTGNLSLLGSCGRLSVNADVSGVNVGAGLWGLLEVKSSGVVGGSTGMGAVLGDININTSGDIGSGKIASCFLAHCESLGNSHTGKAAVIHVPNPDLGTFDAFVAFGSATGACASGSTALSGLTSAYHITVLCPDGNVHYIPVV